MGDSNSEVTMMNSLDGFGSNGVDVDGFDSNGIDVMVDADENIGEVMVDSNGNTGEVMINSNGNIGEVVGGSNGFHSNGNIDEGMDLSGFDATELINEVMDDLNGFDNGSSGAVMNDSKTKEDEFSFMEDILSNGNDFLADEDIFLEKNRGYKENCKGSTSYVREEELCLTKEDEDEFVSFTNKASALFFDEYGLVSHQINSYNAFINTGVQGLFNSLGETTVEPSYDPSKKGDGSWKYASIRFGKATLEPPTYWVGESNKVDSRDSLKFFPRNARLQNVTYSAKLKVEMTVQVYTQRLSKSDKFKTGKEQHIQKDIESEVKSEVMIGRIPVMVKSNICWMSSEVKGDCDFDHGGYFLVKGTEKAFIAQEETCLTRLLVRQNPNWGISYRSGLRRHRDWKKGRIYLKLEPSDTHNLQGQKILNVQFMACSIPLWIFLFSLDLTSDKEIVDEIDINLTDASFVNVLYSTINLADTQCEGFRNREKAMEYIEETVKKTKFPISESVEDFIYKYLFPNLKSNRRKALFLCYMVKCLWLAYTGKRKMDNKDDFRNKRISLAGELLERELRVHVHHVKSRMAKQMQRDLNGDRSLQPIEHYLDASIVTNGLNRAFSTGAWTSATNYKEKIAGVVETVRRVNPLQMVSDMRKTRQRVNYNGKAGDARYPHPSHWGRLCFLSTKDGEHCGLVKNLAATGLVTTDLAKPFHETLFECGMEEIPDDLFLASLKDKCKIFLNGEWIGVCDDSCSFVNDLRTKRRSKELPLQVEIVRDKDQKEVRVFSDAGRILRPLLVVENLKKLKSLQEADSFQSILDQGLIELIGVEEEEDFQTAWGFKQLLTVDKDQSNARYTHCELDSSFLLGLSCGIIPFANHDHARRVLYQSEKHSQQAIGFSTTNPKIRVDTTSQQLFYPQRPLFRTSLSDCLVTPELSQGHNRVLPKPEYFNGQNAIVAVNVHQGYNQEDSLVMNRASLERGMFRTEHTRSYKSEVDNKELLETKRMKEKDKVSFGKIQSKFGRVDSLDDDGLPFIGANLQDRDIIIGKYAESGADHSIRLKHTEKGIVQKVVLSANDDGKNFAVVSLRQVRSPCLGDKFSSMHGQKGVVGLLESQENFPFTQQGIVPDIVINPHAFPTRQTAGQLLEAALGKGIACGGSKDVVNNATPFATPSAEVIMDQLHRVGFSRWGTERLYHGHNGKKLSALIFIGPTFYQRLNHMAEDKVKFRNTGPVHPLTRQPVQDRKRYGGIKFGEMERDCLLAHGASSNLFERLFTLSDFAQMYVCHTCHHVAPVILRTVPGGAKIRGPYCNFCNSAEEILRVNLPHGGKLLYQELFSMGISLKFTTEVC